MKPKLKIELDRNFYIVPDPYCWILKRRDRSHNSDTYHANLKQALRSFYDEVLKETPMVEKQVVELLLDRIDHLEQIIENIKELRRG